MKRTEDRLGLKAYKVIHEIDLVLTYVVILILLTQIVATIH